MFTCKLHELKVSVYCFWQCFSLPFREKSCSWFAFLFYMYNVRNWVDLQTHQISVDQVVTTVRVGRATTSDKDVWSLRLVLIFVAFGGVRIRNMSFSPHVKGVTPFAQRKNFGLIELIVHCTVFFADEKDITCQKHQAKGNTQKVVLLKANALQPFCGLGRRNDPSHIHSLCVPLNDQKRGKWRKRGKGVRARQENCSRMLWVLFWLAEDRQEKSREITFQRAKTMFSVSWRSRPTAAAVVVNISEKHAKALHGGEISQWTNMESEPCTLLVVFVFSRVKFTVAGIRPELWPDTVAFPNVSSRGEFSVANQGLRTLHYTGPSTALHVSVWSSLWPAMTSPCTLVVVFVFCRGEFAAQGVFLQIRVSAWSLALIGKLLRQTSHWCQHCTVCFQCKVSCGQPWHHQVVFVCCRGEDRFADPGAALRTHSSSSSRARGRRARFTPQTAMTWWTTTTEGSAAGADCAPASPSCAAPTSPPRDRSVSKTYTGRGGVMLRTVPRQMLFSKSIALCGKSWFTSVWSGKWLKSGWTDDFRVQQDRMEVVSLPWTKMSSCAHCLPKVGLEKEKASVLAQSSAVFCLSSFGGKMHANSWSGLVFWLSWDTCTDCCALSLGTNHLPVWVTRAVAMQLMNSGMGWQLQQPWFRGKTTFFSFLAPVQVGPIPFLWWMVRCVHAETQARTCEFINLWNQLPGSIPSLLGSLPKSKECCNGVLLMLFAKRLKLRGCK